MYFKHKYTRKKKNQHIYKSSQSTRPKHIIQSTSVLLEFFSSSYSYYAVPGMWGETIQTIVQHKNTTFKLVLEV